MEPHDEKRTMNGTILANRSSTTRGNTDFYPTPSECTQALLNFLQIPKNATIWEPACGKGHIANVLNANGYKTVSTDLYDYGGLDGVEDFLNSPCRECDWIITNPPFSQAEPFIEKCLEHKKPFALLLKSQYWHSKRRYELFIQHKPQYVLPLTWRPDFEFGKRGGSPTMECLWTVWGATPANATIYIPLKKEAK